MFCTFLGSVYFQTNHIDGAQMLRNFIKIKQGQPPCVILKTVVRIDLVFRIKEGKPAGLPFLTVYT